jgi:hypothetical protein
MLNRNITKIFTFVITLGAVSVIFSACGAVSSNNGILGENVSNQREQTSAVYKAPKIVGTIDSKEIRESSGLAHSPCQPDVIWTHNDSDDDAFIYALSKTGKKLATFKVAGAKNDDWEDMAIRRDSSGACFLYVGDIGNNERLKSELTVYKVKEPTVSAATDSSRKNPLLTDAAEAIKFEYPDARHDAETLLIHPQTGDIYVLTKRFTGAAGVYRLKADYDSAKTNRLEKIADITVPAIPNGLLTGGAIAPDGKRVVLCDYFAAYEITLPKDAKNFDEIWRQKPQKIETGARTQGEAVAYSSDGNAIYATSEKKDSPLILIERK